MQECKLNVPSKTIHLQLDQDVFANLLGMWYLLRENAMHLQHHMKEKQIFMSPGLRSLWLTLNYTFQQLTVFSSSSTTTRFFWVRNRYLSCPRVFAKHTAPPELHWHSWSLIWLKVSLPVVVWLLHGKNKPASWSKVYTRSGWLYGTMLQSKCWIQL